MDYQKHYDLLINKAQNRKLDGYSEKHHILPKCLGGSNDKINLVRLTPEEHFVAHKLLVKIYPNNQKLWWALVAMTNKTGKMARSNRLYGYFKREFSKRMKLANSIRVISDETRAKMSAARLGRKFQPHSKETKEKMSLASKGRKKSEEHKQSMSKERTGKKRGPHSEETKRKIRESNIKTAQNRTYEERKTPEYKEKQRINTKELWLKRNEGLIAMPSRKNSVKECR